jgi:hypothetical protein
LGVSSSLTGLEALSSEFVVAADDKMRKPLKLITTPPPFYIFLFVVFLVGSFAVLISLHFAMLIASSYTGS